MGYKHTIPAGITTEIINACRKLHKAGYRGAQPFNIEGDGDNKGQKYHCIPMLLPQPCVQVFPFNGKEIESNKGKHLDVFTSTKETLCQKY